MMIMCEYLCLLILCTALQSDVVHGNDLISDLDSSILQQNGVPDEHAANFRFIMQTSSIDDPVPNSMYLTYPVSCPTLCKCLYKYSNVTIATRVL